MSQEIAALVTMLMKENAELKLKLEEAHIQTNTLNKDVEIYRTEMFRLNDILHEVGYYGYE